MTEVAGPQESKDAVIKDGGSINNGEEKATMEVIKTEDAPAGIASVVNVIDEKPQVANDEVDAEADSEAETLIQSPEKKRNIVDSAPSLQPTQPSNSNADVILNATVASESGNRSRKRKRSSQDADYEASSRASSPPDSPLSSPAFPSHSRDSDSDRSTRHGPRVSRSAKSKRNANHDGDSDNGEISSIQPKVRRRRPSDVVSIPKHRQKGQNNSVDTAISERRETRSATYPRHSSDERSPSPRPASRREHRRGASTQLMSGDFERKKRGRPPLINTRRNRSVDRAASTSSDDSSSPAHQRPKLHKFTSNDHDVMSPAKVTGPRKWRDKNGRTFLSRACNNNDVETAKARHAERPEDINLPDNAGNTPLQIAALEGFVDIVRFLLENNAQVDTRNIDKETPLIDAVENGHLEVVKLLLDHGANPRLGNAKGDEPFELVPQDDENYHEIRRLLAEAKEKDVTKRRKSTETAEPQKEGGSSSRAASAASPRDSPPIIGPRSPPPFASSRRRTGRSESTRNDLLWQANTQENLTRLAAKGDVQGVASILNILQKADPESVIAAAKAGHEEVLQYLLAMGDADPDPDPVSSMKSGFNTPMLAAIGRGNLDVVKLLVEQSQFNPTRKYRGKYYFEIAAERKGEEWQKEHDVLKTAAEKYSSGKPRKTSSPKKSRDQDRLKVRQQPRSTSPVSSNLRHSTSPTMTHKSLPNKSPESMQKDKRKELPSKSITSRDLGESSIAVTSDQDQTSSIIRKGHKIRRSQSDAQPPANLEPETTHRRRRLVTGKEHRRRKSAVGGPESGDEGSDSEVKKERPSSGLKRPRNSVSPGMEQEKEMDAARLVVKKRRTVPDSSPEESRPGLKKKLSRMSSDNAEKDVEMKDIGQKPPSDSEGPVTNHRRTRSEQAAAAAKESSILQIDTVAAEPTRDKQPDVETKTEDTAQSVPDEVSTNPDSKDTTSADRPTNPVDEKEQQERIRLEAEQAAQEAKRIEEERNAAEQAAIEKRKEEEAAAKKKAEEEAQARKRDDEERQERMRRDLEDRQRRQEEQIRQQHLEIERRRREALPAALCKCAYMLDTNDASYKTHKWLSRFLPLFTVKTRQLDPASPVSTAEDEWIPNFQVACLLATKDLNLRNYTSLEKRPVNALERDRLWKVARMILSYDYETNGLNTSIKQACVIEQRERPKFFAMEELFWVKLSDFEDQVFRHGHLSGMHLRKQPISLRIIESSAYSSPSPQPNGVTPSPKLANGTSPLNTNGIYGNGQNRL